MGVQSERTETVKWRVADETDGSYGSVVVATFDDDGDCSITDDEGGTIKVSRFVCAELARALLMEMKRRGLDEGFF